MAESDFVAHEIPQQTVDPNGEPIVYKARCLYNELEDALCRSYATNTCVVAGCIGLLLFCPLYRRRSRQVAETWQLYVTDRSFVHTIVHRRFSAANTHQQFVFLWPTSKQYLSTSLSPSAALQLACGRLVPMLS